MNFNKGGTHRKPAQQKIYQQVINKLSTTKRRKNNG